MIAKAESLRPWRSSSHSETLTEHGATGGMAFALATVLHLLQKRMTDLGPCFLRRIPLQLSGLLLDFKTRDVPRESNFSKRGKPAHILLLLPAVDFCCEDIFRPNRFMDRVGHPSN